jgi:hypothetical protein
MLLIHKYAVVKLQKFYNNICIRGVTRGGLDGAQPPLRRLEPPYKNFCFLEIKIFISGFDTFNSAHTKNNPRFRLHSVNWRYLKGDS